MFVGQGLEQRCSVEKNFLRKLASKNFSLLGARLNKWIQSLGILKKDFWKQQIVRQATLDN